MSCRKIQRLVQLYVDGAASRSEREAVDRHLAGCGECARALAESRRLVGMLASPPARQVSDGFERELMAALRQTAPAPRTVAWWERFRLRFEWRLRMPAMVAAGSLAAAVCAAVVVPRVAERQQERKVFLSATVQRYHELERADSDVNYEAVDSSVELSTGTLLRE